MFEVRAELVITVGIDGEVRTRVVGAVKARVVVFERRARCVILAGIVVVVVARVVWTFRD